MRYVQKSVEPPESLRKWLAEQIPVGLNLDYTSFRGQADLRRELIEEQYGLCPYTGAPLDGRLSTLQDANLAFRAHIEHVKPRSVCKRELEERGGVYGRERCEDMDYRNLIAALEVKGKPPSKSEVFGAAAHGNEQLPITPFEPNCEQRFEVDELGRIHGLDDPAKETIALLKLDHITLTGWRSAAIAGFLPGDLNFTREELVDVSRKLANPVDGTLAEFSFCIQGYIRHLLRNAE